MTRTASDEHYVLWSIEHHAWWAPNECGYSETLNGAGVYRKARALAIVARANVRTFNECAIPLTALDGTGTLALRAHVEAPS